jgi:hypothetical protein
MVCVLAAPRFNEFPDLPEFNEAGDKRNLALEGKTVVLVQIPVSASVTRTDLRSHGLLCKFTFRNTENTLGGLQIDSTKVKEVEPGVAEKMQV